MVVVCCVVVDVVVVRELEGRGLSRYNCKAKLVPRFCRARLPFPGWLFVVGKMKDAVWVDVPPKEQCFPVFGGSASIGCGSD